LLQSSSSRLSKSRLSHLAPCPAQGDGIWPDPEAGAQRNSREAQSPRRERWASGAEKSALNPSLTGASPLRAGAMASLPGRHSSFPHPTLDSPSTRRCPRANNCLSPHTSLSTCLPGHGRVAPRPGVASSGAGTIVTCVQCQCVPPETRAACGVQCAPPPGRDPGSACCRRLSGAASFGVGEPGLGRKAGNQALDSEHSRALPIWMEPQCWASQSSAQHFAIAAANIQAITNHTYALSSGTRGTAEFYR
jgi:hypothetical protein